MMADLAFTAVTLFWMFIGAVAVGGFSFIMMLILAMFTPAMPFLRAKMRKVPILAVRRTDRKIDYTPVKKFIQPLAIHDEYGGFIVDPESVYTSQKGGVSVLPVNGEIGITLSDRVLGVIDALKRAKIDNIEEAEWLADHWGQCVCGFLGLMEKEGNMLTCPNKDVPIEEVKNEDIQEERPPAEEPKPPEPPRPPEPTEPPTYVSRADSAAPDAAGSAAAFGPDDHL